MKKHFHHNRATGQAGGRATEGWPRRGETSGSERVKEHGGHGEEEKFFLIIRISGLHFISNFFITPSFFHSVVSVSSVVKPLFSSLA